MELPGHAVALTPVDTLRSAGGDAVLPPPTVPGAPSQRGATSGSSPSPADSPPSSVFRVEVESPPRPGWRSSLADC
eukprot:487384-Alexandrium_andersonii.AAC.1